MKLVKVFMGIPSTGTREDAQTYTLRKIEQKYKGQIELVYPDIFVGRLFHDHARNAYVEAFLKSDCDILWFLDSDVVPPSNCLDLIVDHGDKWKLAGVSYPVFMGIPGYESPQVVFTVYIQDANTKALHASKIPESGLSWVDGMATGCIFIHREVFEKLSKPYFEFKYNSESRDIVEGEDLGFCKKVLEHGYRFFTDFSMVCHHYKKVSLLDVNNYAMKQVEQAIRTCDVQLRQILAKAKLNQAKPKRSNLILPK